MVGEGNADTVGAEGPVEGVRGWGEVCEEGNGGGEGGKFGKRDGGEAVVVECTICTYEQSARVQILPSFCRLGSR